jgi:CRP-like cAMP-binding protein
VNITLTPEHTGNLAQNMGIPAADLAAIISRGASHPYKAGDYLYHESTPRLWMGIVEEGEIEIIRGLHGSSVRLATLTCLTARDLRNKWITLHCSTSRL